MSNEDKKSQLIISSSRTLDEFSKNASYMMSELITVAIRGILSSETQFFW